MFVYLEYKNRSQKLEKLWQKSVLDNILKNLAFSS
jgi:hypothetical protein